MNPISIDELKNDNDSVIVDPNVTRGVSISGQEVRDFGNGVTEFDPAANGFKPAEIDRGENDIDKALRDFDDMFDKRVQEVEVFNDLVEINGTVTEAELRDALGESHVTQVLQDGEGGKFEDSPGVKAPEVVSQNIVNFTAVAEAPSELDELEKELEEDDDMDINHTQNENITNIKSTAETVSVEPILSEISKPKTVEFVDLLMRYHIKCLKLLVSTANRQFQQKIKMRLVWFLHVISW